MMRVKISVAIALLVLFAIALSALSVGAGQPAMTPDDTATEQAKAATAEAEGLETWRVYLPFVMPCDDPRSPIMCYLRGPGW